MVMSFTEIFHTSVYLLLYSCCLRLIPRNNIPRHLQGPVVGYLGGDRWPVAFASFYGVSTPVVVDFKLYQHDISEQSSEEILHSTLARRYKLYPTPYRLVTNYVSTSQSKVTNGIIGNGSYDLEMTLMSLLKLDSV